MSLTVHNELLLNHPAVGCVSIELDEVLTVADLKEALNYISSYRDTNRRIVVLTNDGATVHVYTGLYFADVTEVSNNREQREE